MMDDYFPAKTDSPLGAIPEAALSAVNDIVCKNFFAELEKLDVLPMSAGSDSARQIRLFRLDEISSSKDEPISQKLATVYNSLSMIDCTLFMIISSNGQTSKFYIGVRVKDNRHTASSVKETLKRAMTGQFPGVKIHDKFLNSDITDLIQNINSDSISSVSCIANNREKYIQGLEKFTQSMQGEKYTALILADNSSREQIIKLREDYERIYTQLSRYANYQVSQSQNQSTSQSDGTSSSQSTSSSYTDSTSRTNGTSYTNSDSESNSTNSKTFLGALANLTVILAPLATKTKSHSITNSSSKSTNKSESFSTSSGTSQSSSQSTSHTQTQQSGTSASFTLTHKDRNITSILEQIDTQLKRIKEFESFGMWDCAAYFMSPNSYVSEIAASNYKALMSGENSGLEMSAINSWSINSRDEHIKSQAMKIAEYVKNFQHPVFRYSENLTVTPSTFVSGLELSLHMGLPQISVRGLPVIEHAPFAPEIVRYDKNHDNSESIELGNIFNMGADFPGKVELESESLTMHTLVTGSTGSGKSNTIYNILDDLAKSGKKFMVIEPSKGEYKHVFGTREDLKVRVLGTNENVCELLRLNPFKFCEKIHVLEHIDRLLDVFNVCWGMYAAMPALLKAAIIRAYETCGWDVAKSECKYENTFPNFHDLQFEIKRAINNSSYSSDTKSDYAGALLTRISSLSNGINGKIFCETEPEISDSELFDENVIIDLSRVGSIETKALITGILLIRLQEYRLSESESVMNSNLRHVTVLEEAHNLLKRTSTEQNMDSSNVTGKSVEMLSNSIAEMRTYGEGFIIADQSPNALDMSAIRNTNTKIIMRLPDESDRFLSGKSASLSDSQLDELSRLPSGVAAIYQNDWQAPVLCHVRKYVKSENRFYEYRNARENYSPGKIMGDLMRLLLNSRLNHDVRDKTEIDLRELESGLRKLPVRTSTRIELERNIREYERLGKILLCDEKRYSELSNLVTELICGEPEKLEQILDTDFSASDLQRILSREVSLRVPDLSLIYKLEICQCLMRTYTGRDSERERLYAEWRESL